MNTSICVLAVGTSLQSARSIASTLEAVSDRFTVDITESPQNALKQLSTAKFDCLLSEYELSEMDGIAFLEAVREEYPRLPFILYTDTGPTLPEGERKAIELGEETATVHGSGIGLWLMHWVVTCFGGEVKIEENDPRGNIVTLRLPTVDSLC